MHREEEQTISTLKTHGLSYMLLEINPFSEVRAMHAYLELLYIYAVCYIPEMF